MNTQMMNDTQGRRSSPRRFLAIAMMGVGGVLLLINLEPFDFELHIWQLWPLVMVAAGVYSLVVGSWLEGILLIGLGGAFLAVIWHPGLDMADVWRQWPMLLVVAGVATVLRALIPQRTKPSRQGRGGGAFFKSLHLVRDSDGYLGDGATAVLGTYNLDLSAARLDPRGAVIEVFAFWGGINITVPEDWAVDMQVIPLMGGAEDKSRPPAPAVPPELDAPRLQVRGFVWMAGLEIHN